MEWGFSIETNPEEDPRWQVLLLENDPNDMILAVKAPHDEDARLTGINT